MPVKPSEFEAFGINYFRLFTISGRDLFATDKIITAEKKQKRDISVKQGGNSCFSGGGGAIVVNGYIYKGRTTDVFTTSRTYHLWFHCTVGLWDVLGYMYNWSMVHLLQQTI